MRSALSNAGDRYWRAAPAPPDRNSRGPSCRIWAWLAAQASEDVATRLVKQIEKAFEPVRYFPLAFLARDALAPGLRVTFHRAYAIYYQPRPTEIVIIRLYCAALAT